MGPCRYFTAWCKQQPCITPVVFSYVSVCYSYFDLLKCFFSKLIVFLHGIAQGDWDSVTPYNTPYGTPIKNQQQQEEKETRIPLKSVKNLCL